MPLRAVDSGQGAHRLKMTMEESATLKEGRMNLAS